MRATAKIMKGKDIELSDQHFTKLCGLVYRHTGIALTDAKRELVKRRFSPRIRELGLRGFSEYCDLIDHKGGSELTLFTNAITTNLTSFFREKHHFEYLKKEILPNFYKKHGHRKLRIWSAGCSTGEEVYSIAITLREALLDIDRWDIKILATDIDTDILHQASQGIYEGKRLEDFSPEWVSKWFKKGRGGNSGRYQIKKSLKDLIYFQHLNLIENWPIRNNFDIIFCRNVIIYFDFETKKKLVGRFNKAQKEGDYLFLGHSENLHNTSIAYELIGKSIYSKQKTGR